MGRKSLITHSIEKADKCKPRNCPFIPVVEQLYEKIKHIEGSLKGSHIWAKRWINKAIKEQLGEKISDVARDFLQDEFSEDIARETTNYLGPKIADDIKRNIVNKLTDSIRFELQDSFKEQFYFMYYNMLTFLFLAERKELFTEAEFNRALAGLKRNWQPQYRKFMRESNLDLKLPENKQLQEVEK